MNTKGQICKSYTFQVANLSASLKVPFTQAGLTLINDLQYSCFLRPMPDLNGRIAGLQAAVLDHFTNGSVAERGGFEPPKRVSAQLFSGQFPHRSDSLLL